MMVYIHTLVGEFAVLGAVVRFHIEAMPHAPVEIASYLRRSGYIPRLLGREDEGVAHEKGIGVEST